MNRCTSVQERLADEGVALTDRDAAIREHVAGCGDCGAFVEALRQVDAGMSRLPALVAPRSLVARTAKTIAGDPKPPIRHSGADAGARNLAASLAAVVVLAAGFALTESVQQELDQVERFVAQQFSIADRLEGYSASDSSLQAPALRAPAPRQAKPSSVMPKSLAEPEPVAEAVAAPLAPFAAFEPSMDSSTVSRPGEATHAPAGDVLALQSSRRSRSNEGLASAAQPSKEREKRDQKAAGKSKREPGSAGLSIG